MKSITPSFGGSPSQATAVKRRPLAANTSPGPNFRWAVSVSTCERPGGSTLDRTIDSILDSGWDSVEVFADGSIGRCLPANFFDHPRRQDVRTHDRPNKIGAYSNFLSMVAETFVSDPKADAYLFLQDDVLLAKNCRAYLETTLRNDSLRNRGVVWSLYSSGVDYDSFVKRRDLKPGWKETRRGWGMQGALTVVMTTRDVISFLSSVSTWMHRVERGEKSNRQIDAEVGKWAEDNIKPAMFHHPSLAQHIGEHSSIYQSIDTMSDRRSSATFVGTGFDTLTFLKKEEKAVDYLADASYVPAPVAPLTYGIYGTLGLNPEGFATARLAELELTRSVLILPVGGFPHRGNSIAVDIVGCATGTSIPKIARAFDKCDVIMTTLPMTVQAISWAKANDKDIIAIPASVPKVEKGKDSPWKNTLRASRLALTAWESEVEVLEALGAKNVVAALPEPLVPRSGPSTRPAIWHCGADTTLPKGNGTRIIFTNRAHSVRGQGDHVFDLTQQDHEEFLSALGACDSIQGFDRWNILHTFLRHNASDESPTLIPEGEFDAFLKEKLNPWRAEA